MLSHDVNNYVKRCDICLALKAVRHKPYNYLQSLPIFTHCWKDLSIEFVIGLPILTDWKEDSYDSILVIIDRLIKKVYYKSVKVTINALGLAKIIINIVVKYYSLPDLIITDRGSLFTSRFWSMLCYFLDIKQKISAIFYP